MDKLALINQIIVNLNRLSVQGVDNMSIVMGSIQALGKLSQCIQAEQQEVNDNEEADIFKRDGERMIQHVQLETVD